MKNTEENEDLIDLKTKIIKLVDNKTKNKVGVNTEIEGFRLFRREAPTQLGFCIIPPSIFIVIQGVEHISSGADKYKCDNKKFLLSSLVLPISSSVTSATSEYPYLGISLTIDMKIISELITLGYIPRESNSNTESKVGIGALTTEILDPYKRLLLLLNDPESIPVLSPMIIREIHYRILKSELSSKLRYIISIERSGQKILKSIDWMKYNFKQPLRIEMLAKEAQMSAPSIYHYYKKILGMSPLQFQKWLRLNEARSLMLNENIDASSASYNVGYESPSQFNREYKRLFGLSPKRDIEILLSTVIKDI